MRIISGLYKGRIIDMVDSDETKETSDRVRQSVFNVLGNQIEGRILDLFSGSGAYALEALSRGASYAVAVDHQKKAYVTIIQNAKKLGLVNQMQIIFMDAHLYLKTNHEPFDYVFIDPPYAYDNYDGLLESIASHLNASGIVIVETHKKTTLRSSYDGLEMMFDRLYGIKRIAMYQHKL